MSSDQQASQDSQQSADSKPTSQATVIVRGEVAGGENAADPSKSKQADAQSKDKAPPNDKAPPKPLSEARVQAQKRLPVLDDQHDVGVDKAQVVTRDGKADLTFSGRLLASVAPDVAPNGQWQELRVYETDSGNHVFSKIIRDIAADKEDTHEAEIFDSNPSSKAAQLLRTARDLTRSHPVTWTDAAVSFFGYEPLAKSLYQKLPGEFEERIS